MHPGESVLRAAQAGPVAVALTNQRLLALRRPVFGAPDAIIDAPLAGVVRVALDEQTARARIYVEVAGDLQELELKGAQLELLAPVREMLREVRRMNPSILGAPWLLPAERITVGVRTVQGTFYLTNRRAVLSHNDEVLFAAAIGTLNEYDYYPSPGGWCFVLVVDGLRHVFRTSGASSGTAGLCDGVWELDRIARGCGRPMRYLRPGERVRLSIPVTLRKNTRQGRNLLRMTTERVLWVHASRDGRVSVEGSWELDDIRLKYGSSGIAIRGENDMNFFVPDAKNLISEMRALSASPERRGSLPAG